jgi:dienelactone hydrolase
VPDAKAAAVVEALHDDGVEIIRNSWVELLQLEKMAGDDLFGAVTGILRADLHLAREDLIHDDAKGEHVRRGGGLPATGLFGGHVFRRARPWRDFPQAPDFFRVGKPEISNDRTRAIKQNITGFEVAMNNFLPMQIIQTFGCLIADVDELTIRILLAIADDVGEAAVAEEIHQQVKLIFQLGHPVDANDVGVVDDLAESLFALEAVEALFPNFHTLAGSGRKVLKSKYLVRLFDETFRDRPGTAIVKWLRDLTVFEIDLFSIYNGKNLLESGKESLNRHREVPDNLVRLPLGDSMTATCRQAFSDPVLHWHWMAISSNVMRHAARKGVEHHTSRSTGRQKARKGIICSMFIVDPRVCHPRPACQNPAPQHFGDHMFFYRDIVLEREGSSLAGTLTEPAELTSPVPAVLLIADLWEGLEQKEVMRAIAAELGHRGIASFAIPLELESNDSLRQIEDLLDDAQQALAYLRAQPMVDSRCCGILGYGVGAPIAATLSIEDGRLLTIVMLTPLLEWDVLLPPRSLFPGRRAGLKIPEVSRNWLEATKSSRLLGAYGDLDLPVLLVHGNRDPFIPLRHSQEIRTLLEQKDCNVKLVSIEGADHTFVADNLRQFVGSEVANWFELVLQSAAV